MYSLSCCVMPYVHYDDGGLWLFTTFPHSSLTWHLTLILTFVPRSDFPFSYFQYMTFKIIRPLSLTLWPMKDFWKSQLALCFLVSLLTGLHFSWYSQFPSVELPFRRLWMFLRPSIDCRVLTPVPDIRYYIPVQYFFFRK